MVKSSVRRDTIDILEELDTGLQDGGHSLESKLLGGVISRLWESFTNIKLSWIKNSEYKD